MKVYQKTFDVNLGETLKEDGMDRAATLRVALLDIAQAEAMNIARSRPERTCCADDVQEAIIARGYHPSQLGNAAGKIFSGDHWRFTGIWIKSTRASNHARMIRLWELKS